MADNGWEKLVKFINKKELGHIFKRSELLLWANVNDLSGNTIDMYRNQLVHAGIWKRVKSGTYELQSKLPENTTTTELYLLYKGDRLKYLEKVVQRKEREKEIAAENERVAKLTEVNNRIISELLSRPCLDCKGSYPKPAMIFSYRQVPRHFRALSKLILRETKDFVDELEKCDVVCFNCHLIRQTSTPFLK